MSLELTADAETKRPRPRWGFLVLLMGLTAGCVVAGIVFLVRGAHVSDSGATANRAVIDATTSPAVTGQVSDALNQVLSYTYQHPETAQRAAATWLTGDAV